jgi:phosphomannomutase
LEKTAPEKLKSNGIAIGYDHRLSKSAGVDSEMMALTAAAVCVSRGIKTYLFCKQVATPILAFIVKYKQCAAGMMVTASHNPKDDNGYKMYGGNGAQLCDPHDAHIAEQILLNLKPWTDYQKATAVVRASPLCVDALQEVSDAYFAAMASQLCFHPAANAASNLRIVYTAMHGVGTPFAERAFRAFSHKPFIPVPAQVEPDPEFPTVAYPNPEEGKGALELSFAEAAKHGSPLVLANDPDADRLAAAEQQVGSKPYPFYVPTSLSSCLHPSSAPASLLRACPLHSAAREPSPGRLPSSRGPALPAGEHGRARATQALRSVH